ncbi:Mor transcription activator family protein [uncultured Xanthomonas sp.]|uniref:Mor transcription activator family protein n=1 Tax=uncultured Xanthomonas sp. TaxID=152831 RepID=UPI0025F79F17|nr:Mor transcription activator family protein [uncultured Xanthomonas sp.]
MNDQPDMWGTPTGLAAIELIERGNVDVPEDRWAPMLAAMVAVLEATYRRLGLGDAQSAKLATAGVLAQAEYAGGRMLYLPRGDRLRKALRDAEIYHRARRGNIQQLAAEYGLTDIHIYRICREQKELYMSKVQGRFNFGDS